MLSIILGADNGRCGYKMKANCFQTDYQIYEIFQLEHQF